MVLVQVAEVAWNALEKRVCVDEICARPKGSAEVTGDADDPLHLRIGVCRRGGLAVGGRYDEARSIPPLACQYTLNDQRYEETGTVWRDPYGSPDE